MLEIIGIKRNLNLIINQLLQAVLYGFYPMKVKWNENTNILKKMFVDEKKL